MRFKQRHIYLVAFIMSVFIIGYILKKIFVKEMFEDVKIIPSCPSGYKQFTDKPGNNACCSSSINYTDSTCNGSVCTLQDNIQDPNKPGKLYEKCKK